MSMFNTIPNPLARKINRDTELLIDAICEATEPLLTELMCSLGQEQLEGGKFGEYRPSTNEECCEITCRVYLSATLDARKSLPKQLVAWMQTCIEQLNEAANTLKDVTDTRARSRLIREVGQKLAPH